MAAATLEFINILGETLFRHHQYHRRAAPPLMGWLLTHRLQYSGPAAAAADDKLRVAFSRLESPLCNWRERRKWWTNSVRDVIISVSHRHDHMALWLLLLRLLSSVSLTNENLFSYHPQPWQSWAYLSVPAIISRSLQVTLCVCPMPFVLGNV